MGTAIDYWDPWDQQERPPLAQYDPDGCVMLLAAVVRRWWLDALLQSQRWLLCDLAEFLEVDVQTLEDTRPAKFYAERRSVFWLEEPT